MKRSDAKKIAETITNQQLFEMLQAAKEGITDWRKVSSCNKGFTKGSAWNVLAKGFDPSNQNIHFVYKTNLIHEFGDFLPDSLKIKKPAINYPEPSHKDPDFDLLGI